MYYQKLITGGIKRLRANCGLTQEQFAEKINMSVQGYRNIEHNKYLPTGDTIDKICNVRGRIFSFKMPWLLLLCLLGL